MNNPQKIYRLLEKTIAKIEESKEFYVENPEKDFTRNRKLPMSEVIRTMLAMHGGSLNKELYLRSVQMGETLTASAFVQQRAKIRLEAFVDMIRIFNTYCKDRKTYRGYRLYAVDGSDINVYRNPDTDSYITTKSHPEGHNLLHLNALYDLLNHTYTDCTIKAKHHTNERKELYRMLERNTFDQKSIVITDRGYDGYNTIAHFLNTPNVHFLCRIQTKNTWRPLKKFPEGTLDEDISIEITTSQSKEDKRKGRIFLKSYGKSKRVEKPKNNGASVWDFPSPYPMKFRAVRFQLDSGEYETLVTSLPRDEFSLEDLKKLYHMRWGIETSFRSLKYAVGLVNLHCKKEHFAYQEIYAAILMYNFYERVASYAVVKGKQSKEHLYQVNYTMAFTICKEYFKNRRSFSTIIGDMLRYILPIRPDRADPRKAGHQKNFIAFTYRVAA